MASEDIDALGQMVMARRVKQRLFGVQPPDESSRYVPIERIGRGGGGTVYRAYDSKLRREVAIKVLHVAQDRGLASGLATSVILREARSLAALSHPNVVAVHDVGRVVDGELVSGANQAGDDPSPVFLVMEYIQGQDLGSYVRSKKLNYEQLLALFEQAASGLSAAHRVGLVHRDFKPANVLVGTDGRVRVIDFGLATGQRKDLAELETGSARSELETEQSLHSGMVGTPAYMSPEARTREPMGPKTDQFSFCVALYEAVFGLRPMAWEGKELPAKIPENLHAVPAGTPPDLDRKLARGLSKNPDDRYPSLSDLMVALRAGRRRALWRWWPALVTPILAIVAWNFWEREVQAQCERDPSITMLERDLAALEKSSATGPVRRVTPVLTERIRSDIDAATKRCVREQGRSIGFGPWASFRHRSVQTLLEAQARYPEQLVALRVEHWAQEIAQLRDEAESSPSMSTAQWTRCVQVLLDLDLRWIRGKALPRSGVGAQLGACLQDSNLSLQVQVARHLARMNPGGSVEAAKLAYFAAVRERRADLAAEMAARVGNAILQTQGWQAAQLWSDHASAWDTGSSGQPCRAIVALQDRIVLARDPGIEHYEQIIARLALAPKLQGHRLGLMFELVGLLEQAELPAKAQHLREQLGYDLDKLGLVSDDGKILESTAATAQVKARLFEALRVLDPTMGRCPHRAS